MGPGIGAGQQQIVAVAVVDGGLQAVVLEHAFVALPGDGSERGKVLIAGAELIVVVVVIG